MNLNTNKFEKVLMIKDFDSFLISIYSAIFVLLAPGNMTDEAKL